MKIFRSLLNRFRLFRNFRQRNYDLRTAFNLARSRQREMTREMR